MSCCFSDTFSFIPLPVGVLWRVCFVIQIPLPVHRSARLPTVKMWASVSDPLLFTHFTVNFIVNYPMKQCLHSWRTALQRIQSLNRDTPIDSSVSTQFDSVNNVDVDSVPLGESVLHVNKWCTIRNKGLTHPNWTQTSLLFISMCSSCMDKANSLLLMVQSS